jgi:hypothetical protein
MLVLSTSHTSSSPRASYAHDESHLEAQIPYYYGPLSFNPVNLGSGHAGTIMPYFVPNH